jgi:hypothetical protein
MDDYFDRRLEFREQLKRHQFLAVVDWLRAQNLLETTQREYKDGNLHALVFAKRSEAVLFKLALSK